MSTLTNQRGIALLTVLGLLSILLVLASLVAGSSRMETALSGIGKDGARAFAAAEAGINYGLGDVNNFVASDSLDKGCCEGTGCAYDPRETNLNTAGVFPDTKTTGYVRVCFDHEGPPPTSIKVSALRFKAFHFDLDSRGNAVPNGSSYLQMEAARLGPTQ
jgi:hypothetical protein